MLFVFSVLNGMYSPIGEYEWGTKQHRKLFKEGNAYAQKILKDNNLLSEFYVYWIDEPSEADYDRIIEGNTAIKEGSPEIQILLTEPVVDKLKGYVDAWCPPFVNYVKEDIVERQKLGEEAWTYLCCCPKEKRITLLIDHPASELRLWNWHSFKNNIAGILIWQVMYWTRNYTDMRDPCKEAIFVQHVLHFIYNLIFISPQIPMSRVGTPENIGRGATVMGGSSSLL